jgi:hypothetical protein
MRAKYQLCNSQAGITTPSEYPAWGRQKKNHFGIMEKTNDCKELIPRKDVDAVAARLPSRPAGLGL